MFLGRLGDARAARTALLEAVRVDEAAFGLAAAQTLADVAELAAVSPPTEAAPLWSRAGESADAKTAARALIALGEAQASAGDRPGAAGFYRSRRDPAKGPCDAVNTAGCCMTKLTVAGNDLTPWDQDLVMSLRGPIRMKQFATYFTHGVRNGSRLRADIYHASDATQIVDMVDSFFEQELSAA